MKDDAKKLLTEYAELKRQAAEIQARLDELGPQILSTVQMVTSDEDAERIATDFGTFSIGERHTYKFSDEIMELEADVKRRKKEAIQSGEVLDDKINHYVIFRSNKGGV